MRLVEEQSSHEHQQNRTNNGVNNCRFAQRAVIRAHEREHTEEANHQPRSLAGEEQVGVAELMLRGEGQSAENQYGNVQTPHQGHSSEQAVRSLYTRQPSLLPSP